MVENGVREEIKHLKKRIAIEKGSIVHVQKMVEKSKTEIENWEERIEMLEVISERTESKRKKEIAQQYIKDDKGYIKKQKELLSQHEKALQLNIEMLENLEKRLRELREEA